MTPREALSSLLDADGVLARSDAFFGIVSPRRQAEAEPRPSAADVPSDEPESAHGILAPLLDVAVQAEACGYLRGVDDTLHAAEHLLEQIAESRGTTAYDVLTEVREGLAAVGIRLRQNVVGGLKDEG